MLAHGWPPLPFNFVNARHSYHAMTVTYLLYTQAMSIHACWSVLCLTTFVLFNRCSSDYLALFLVCRAFWWPVRHFLLAPL